MDQLSPSEVAFLRRMIPDMRRYGVKVGVIPPLVLMEGLDGQKVGIDRSAFETEATDTDPLTDEAGFTALCTVKDGSGFVTDVKERVQYGNMFRCVSIDECCLSAWWCIQNEQVELTLACCTPATITRVIRLALTSKTGDCSDLPDLVHLVHTGGTNLTWTSGGAEYWGSRQYSATLTLSCDGANLKADLVISDFTGGTSTTIPCDLTSTGVALGTFTYSGTETDSCGNVTALSGTVDIAVSSWETTGTAVVGVVEFLEDEVPPHDATGPYKTEAEAEACCDVSVELVCADCGTELPYSFPPYITVTLSSKTGTIACLPDSFTIPITPGTVAVLPSQTQIGSYVQPTSTCSISGDKYFVAILMAGCDSATGYLAMELWLGFNTSATVAIGIDPVVTWDFTGGVGSITGGQPYEAGLPIVDCGDDVVLPMTVGTIEPFSGPTSRGTAVVTLS